MTRKKRRKRKRMDTLDKYLIFDFSVLILYTIGHSIVFGITGEEATTLTVSVYAVFGGELVLCALIKKFELQDEYKMLHKKDDSNYEEGEDNL